MIHTTHNPTPARRLAVIEIPRPQRSRMGSIGDGYPARDTTIAWTTIEDAEPSTSDNWLADLLSRQAYARNTTPGTLTYTPASATPAPNVAPWNSWLQPNCGDGSGAPPASPTQMNGVTPSSSPGAETTSKLWLGIGLFTAAAYAAYVMADRKR